MSLEKPPDSTMPPTGEMLPVTELTEMMVAMPSLNLNLSVRVVLVLAMMPLSGLLMPDGRFNGCCLRVTEVF